VKKRVKQPDVAQARHNPERFYPTVSGVVQKFNDLPPQYHPNVNRTEAPYNRNPG